MSWTPKLSYIEQLNRDCNLLPGIACYEEMRKLIWQARRVNLVPFISEKHGGTITPKWMVLDVIPEKGIPYYWLVSFEPKRGIEKVMSFSSAAMGDWPSCMVVTLVPLPSERLIAHPDALRENLRSVEDLNYSTVRSGKPRRRWTSFHKRSGPEIYEALPLGEQYRAIDVGAIIPIFRTETRLIGWTVK